MKWCEVVIAWASGCSWSEALELSGFGPGDLIRALSRALDALRQLGNLPINPARAIDGTLLTETPGIHPDIRRLCKQAVTAMDRYPVKDPLPLMSDDDSDIENNDDPNNAGNSVPTDDSDNSDDTSFTDDSDVRVTDDPI